VFEPACAIRRQFPLDRRAALLQFRLGQNPLPSSIRTLVHERVSASAEQIIHLRHDGAAEVLFHGLKRDSLKDPRQMLFVNCNVEMLCDPANLPLGILQQIRVVHQQDVGQVAEIPP